MSIIFVFALLYYSPHVVNQFLKYIADRAVFKGGGQLPWGDNIFWCLKGLQIFGTHLETAKIYV